jgi:hypothetical protein
MGKTYLFECPKCNYKARVSGGADRGVHFFVQTILCRDCKELYDAVVRLKVPDEQKITASFSRIGFRKPRPGADTPPRFESALNRLAVRGVSRFKWTPFKARCPLSPAHRVQPWNEPGKCPKCGYYLEKNALPFRVWE